MKNKTTCRSKDFIQTCLARTDNDLGHILTALLKMKCNG